MCNSYNHALVILVIVRVNYFQEVASMGHCLSFEKQNGKIIEKAYFKIYY
jgi:hypothetical protein